MPADDKHDSMSSSGRRVSPISVQKHLKGTNYPASRDDLVRRARANAAPDDILRIIEQLPGVRYESPAEVMRAFGQSR